METKSIYEILYDKPFSQVLREFAQKAPIKIMPDKYEEFSEAMTDEDLDKHLNRIHHIQQIEKSYK